MIKIITVLSNNLIELKYKSFLTTDHFRGKMISGRDRGNINYG